MGTIADKLTYLSGTKDAIKNAINATGLTMPANTTFRDYADYISQLTYVPPPKIYGVEWDWTSSGPTKGTRTDDAVGFEDPNPAVNNGDVGVGGVSPHRAEARWDSG